MRKLFLVVLLSLSTAGCGLLGLGRGSRSATDRDANSSRDSNQADQLTPEQRERAALERDIQSRLENTSGLLVVQTHRLNTAAVRAGIDRDTLWRSAVRSWTRGVEGWMNGVDRLHQPLGGQSGLRVLVELERKLLTLEDGLQDLRYAYARLTPENDSVELSLVAIRGIVTSARNAVGLAIAMHAE